MVQSLSTVHGQSSIGGILQKWCQLRLLYIQVELEQRLVDSSEGLRYTFFKLNLDHLESEPLDESIFLIQRDQKMFALDSPTRSWPEKSQARSVLRCRYRYLHWYSETTRSMSLTSVTSRQRSMLSFFSIPMLSIPSELSTCCRVFRFKILENVFQS